MEEHLQDQPGSHEPEPEQSPPADPDEPMFPLPDLDKELREGLREQEEKRGRDE
jgi:hypothetical protein